MKKFMIIIAMLISMISVYGQSVDSTVFNGGKDKYIKSLIADGYERIFQDKTTTKMYKNSDDMITIYGGGNGIQRIEFSGLFKKTQTCRNDNYVEPKEEEKVEEVKYSKPAKLSRFHEAILRRNFKDYIERLWIKAIRW